MMAAPRRARGTSLRFTWISLSHGAAPAPTTRPVAPPTNCYMHPPYRTLQSGLNLGLGGYCVIRIGKARICGGRRVGDSPAPASTWSGAGLVVPLDWETSEGRCHGVCIRRHRVRAGSAGQHHPGGVQRSERQHRHGGSVGSGEAAQPSPSQSPRLLPGGQARLPPPRPGRHHIPLRRGPGAEVGARTGGRWDALPPRARATGGRAASPVCRVRATVWEPPSPPGLIPPSLPPSRHAQSLGRRLPYVFLADVSSRVSDEHAAAAATAPAYALDGAVAPLLRERMHYFNTDPAADAMQRVQGEVEELKSIMVDSIDKVGW